jgi:hypothetical protein
MSTYAKKKILVTTPKTLSFCHSHWGVEYKKNCVYQALSLLHWRREQEERLGGVRPWWGPTTPAYPIRWTHTFTPHSDLPPPLHHIGWMHTLLTLPVPLPSTCHTRHARGSKPPSVCLIACSTARSPTITHTILEQPKFSFSFSSPPSDTWRTIHHHRSGRECTHVLALLHV